MITVIPIFGFEERLPPTLATLERTLVEKFETEAAGVHIHYVMPAVCWADIYLYNPSPAGSPTHRIGFEDGVNPAVLSAFNGEIDELLRNAARLGYAAFDLRRRDTLRLEVGSAAPSHCVAIFDVKRASKNEDKLSHVSLLVMRADRGYLNKVRFTYPTTVEELGNATSLMFMLDWHKAVQARQPQGEVFVSRKEHPKDANQIKMISNSLLSTEMAFPGTVRMRVNPEQVSRATQLLRNIGLRKGMFKSHAQYIYDSLLGNSAAMEAFLPFAVLIGSHSGGNCPCWDGYGRYIGSRSGGEISRFPDRETIINILMNRAQDLAECWLERPF